MERNKKNIMIISYMMFAYMGISFLSQGSLKLEMAESFGITTSKLQYMFTFFSTGSMVMVLLNKVLLNKVSAKVELLISSTSILVGTLLMTVQINVNIFLIGLILSGLGIGVYISLASYLIINSFRKERNSKLNFLHMCYSISAVITPTFAAFLLAINFKWQMVYILLLFIVIGIMILTFKTDFSKLHAEEDEKSQKEVEENWDLRIYLSSAMLFLYVFTEMIFSYWIVEYLVNNGSTGGEGKIALSIFWLFIAIGRFIVGKLGDKVKVKTVVISLLLLALLSYIALITVKGLFIIYFFTGLLGLGFSSLYPSIVALGTEGRGKVTPSLMTFIMISGSIGGVLYSPISGFINAHYNVETTLSIGVFTTCLMLIISFIQRKLKTVVY
ncbi:MAG: MFS transporter [Psychrilyobacter sp.]|nr:MFS transporter [Psychrilyobacter sp.]